MRSKLSSIRIRKSRPVADRAGAGFCLDGSAMRTLSRSPHHLLCAHHAQDAAAVACFADTPLLHEVTDTEFTNDRGRPLGGLCSMAPVRQAGPSCSEKIMNDQRIGTQF